MFFNDICLKDFDDPDQPLDPFGLGLKDHGEPHIWRCGQCTQTFSQRVLLQMHVCPEVSSIKVPLFERKPACILTPVSVRQKGV